MKLDATFAKEIRKTGNGDGSREHRFTLRRELSEVSAAIGHRYEFDNCVKKYGRAKVALCVAGTIMVQQYRFERPQIWWATEVLNLWTNRSPDITETNAVSNLHPAILADNSHSLRMLTTIN